MEALGGFPKAAAVDSLLFLLSFSNDHKLRLYPAFSCILISLLVSELILLSSVLLPPRLYLILYLCDFCNILLAERLILKEGSQGYVFIAHLLWGFLCIIENIQLNCKLIL